MLRLVAGMIVLIAACSTKKNPDFCCLDEADCAQFDVHEFRPCAEGLACIENSCEPASCASAGCAAEAPVCVVATDTCARCTNDDDCMRFADLPVCDDAGGGGCVECVDGSDCPTSEPVCDAKQCRGCAFDDDCPSGACATDGSCVGEANAIYVSTTGADTAPCTRASPCATLAFALSQTTSSRGHIVMAPGSYMGTGQTAFPATHVYIHGHGATLTGGNADFPTMRTRIPTDIQDLELINLDIDGIPLLTLGVTTLDRVTLRGDKGLSAFAPVTARDVVIEAGKIGVDGSTNLVFDRVKIHGRQLGVDLDSATIDFTNVLVFDSDGVGLNFQGVNGTFKFGTVARTGRNGTGVFGAHCGVSNVVFQGSIIWTTNAAGRPPVDGSCTQFVSTIVGPTAVSGATNADPMFVNEVLHDFHLGPSSPARDVVDEGPATDLEGAARPRGARFDLGALEAP